MKYSVQALGAVVLSLTLLAGCSRSSDSSGATTQTPPHMDLEMTGPEYSKLLAEQPSLTDDDDDAIALKPVLDLGKRNLAWLVFINQHRDPAHQVSLSSKETEGASPIDTPKEYNVELTLQSYQALLAQLPAELASVLVQGNDFTENPPLDDASYEAWGLKIDRIYQTGARWLTLKPWRSYYISQRQKDIRGYYFLSREPNLAQELSGYDQLPPNQQANLKQWLIGSCSNSPMTLEGCTTDLNTLIDSHQSLQSYYDQYSGRSKSFYDAFFKMGWQRGDVVWSSSNPTELHIPFLDPGNSGDASLASYVKDNIEDEWRWQGWNLHLDLVKGTNQTAHIELQPGVTPHVVVAENAIVMDANQPRTEYDARWAIRHEFGHILGFVDCYVEFYDEERAVMVSYQIDTTNLMCSRRGALKQTHFDELKRVYFR